LHSSSDVRSRVGNKNVCKNESPEREKMTYNIFKNLKRPNIYRNMQHLLADYYKIGIGIRTNTIANKQKSHNLESSPVQGLPTPQSPPKGAQQPKDRRHSHRPVAAVYHHCHSRLLDQMPNFPHCELQQGTKWTIATTSFLESCDNSSCRHRHRAGTNQPAY
jgi:hypothetical protein